MYHKPLAHWLIQHDYLQVLVAGKDNRELLNGRWDKNDTKDSANAADLVSQAKCQFYEQPDSIVIAVRNLIVTIRSEVPRKKRIADNLIAMALWRKILQETFLSTQYHLYIFLVDTRNIEGPPSFVAINCRRDETTAASGIT